MLTSICRRRTSIGIATAAAVVALASASSADEWKEGHELMLPPNAAPLDPMPGPDAVFLALPTDSQSHEGWLSDQARLRRDYVSKGPLGTAGQDRPGLGWVRQTFVQVQLPIWDRSLYDPSLGTYTVDRFLGSVEPRFGHLDSVLVWQVYPNVGVDDRNQLELLKDMPGGVEGVKGLVDAFHRHGTRVFFPYLVWTRGTRPSSDHPELDYLQLLSEIGADGINFDTLDRVPDAFVAAAGRVSGALAFEPQFTPRAEALGDSPISWNDWVVWDGLAVPRSPRVSRTKWLVPGHQVLVTDRYARMKVDSLQHAFFNGQGYAVLENLWGFWSGMSPWDAEAVYRFTTIERAVAPALASPSWEPYAPTLQEGVYASRFPDGSRTVWTLVNRNEYAVRGEQVAVPFAPGTRYFDLWHGCELTPERKDQQWLLSFDMDALGFGCVVGIPGNPDDSLRGLLALMSGRSSRPLDSFSRAWAPAAQSMVPIAPTIPSRVAPPGMIRMPAADFDFEVRGIEIESANDPGVDVQFPWESIARRYHRHRIQIAAFYIDRTPVTKSQFKRFIDASGYHPRDDHNFLRDWEGRSPKAGAEQEPVTWVSLEDARAYAAWAGKRLPHDWEWQYAAQGSARHLYPWGSSWDAERVPKSDAGPTEARPCPVDAHPSGATDSGILDLVGNVYQWTDEFVDEHTRSAVVRGPGAYQPAGSIWYFPRSYRLDEHEKYLLMSPGRDRSASIGFRCVVDVAP